MSLVSAISSAYLRRTTDFPTGTAWSALVWFKPADPCCTTTFSYLVAIAGASANRGLQFRFTALSSSLGVTGNGYAAVVYSPSPTANAWHAAALTCSGTGATDVNAYLWDSTFALVDENLSLSGASFDLVQTNLWICGSLSKAMLGKIGRMKMWSGGTVLTRTELEAELGSTTITRTTNIYSAFAATDTTVTDYSGQGRNWTLSDMTLDAADDPPVLAAVRSRMSLLGVG